MTDNVTVSSIHLKDEMFGHYSYSKEVTEGITDKYAVKSQLPVHDDMKSAFRKFNPHLAVICEEVHNLEVDDIEKIKVKPADVSLDDFEKSLEGVDQKLFRFVVTTVQFDGTGENAGVTLIGKKKLSTGDWLQLTTPKITWLDSSYFFINELRLASDDLTQEVLDYMDGKQAPRIVQTEMEFPDASVDEEPKKRGRKPKAEPEAE